MCVCIYFASGYFSFFSSLFSREAKVQRVTERGCMEGKKRNVAFFFFLPEKRREVECPPPETQKRKGGEPLFSCSIWECTHTHKRKKTSFFAFPFLFLGNSLNGNNFIYLFLCFGPTQKSHLASSSCSGRLELCCRQFSAQQPLLSPN